MWIVGEDMPQEKNGVTLHPTEKDQHGLPIPIVHFEDHPNDIAMRNHAFKHGRRVYRAAGATKGLRAWAFSLTHNLGTCRQSATPQDGVCNKFGQTHDITNLFISDGSQFTTGAAENPTLDHRYPGDPPGGVSRRADEQGRDLTHGRSGARGRLH